MGNTIQHHIEKTIIDLRALQPRFIDTISRFDEALSSLKGAAEESDLKYRADYWGKLAYRNALIKLRLILEQNLNYVETLGLLAVTRYVFETLVWLRTLERDPKYGLVFFAYVINEQLWSAKQNKKKIEGEIDLFEKLQAEEEQLTRDARPSAAKAADTIRFIAEEIDRRARRAFCRRADDAKSKGYGLQAHFLREKEVPQAQDRIDAFEVELREFKTKCDPAILETKWKWETQAKSAGMSDQYEFIYRYTSRLLHATPVSMFTDQKNLEMPEVKLFLEYVYVAMLDALELGAKHVGMKSGN